MVTIARPWAILLCRFNDDSNDPSKTTVAALYAQWVANFGAATVANWVAADAAMDQRTILQLYEEFFTPAGAGTWNAVTYWDAMSHGSIDISGTQIFPVKLEMSSTEGAAQAANPGGAKYQNAIFQKAKQALSAQYGVDWKSFYGVAVSFQSPDWGAQGGTFDGGPGVYMDVRYVRSSGMTAWGQEMGHGFGLQHSRQQGSIVDYQDPWDIMSTRNAFCNTPDPNYGLRGIGLNAQNMRSRAWLDESRIWRTTSKASFSQQVTLRPLHRRDLTGFLGAEMPAIGSDSPYLVELRVKDGWDSDIPNATVLVHRFEDTHSYLEPGTKAQMSLKAGDVLQIGSGPLVMVVVQSIDVANNAATLQLCYSETALAAPALGIYIIPNDPFCPTAPVEGTTVEAAFDLANAPCGQSYQILWGATGATPAPGVPSNGQTFKFVAPAPGVQATVTLTLVFEDGTMATASHKFNSISFQSAAWQEFFCKLRQEDSLKPIPWWEWDPEKIREIAQQYTRAELRLIAQRATQVLQTMNHLGENVHHFGRE